MGKSSNCRPCSVAWVLGASAFLLHCGARTPLSDRVADASSSDSFPVDAADSGADSSVEAGQDTGVADAAVASCLLKQVGEPQEVFALSAQDLYTPSMVVLDRGDSASGIFGRVALQAVGDGIRLMNITVHEPTSSGVVLGKSESLFVGGGMTYGQMVHAPGNIQQLALVWGADGPGNVFRTVDIPTWTLGAWVQVGQGGSTPNGLAAGRGVPNTQTGQYDGDGYGMTWQGVTGEAASVVVLSAKGEIQVGPLWTSAPVPKEMTESSIAWSGTTYLMATRFNACAAGDVLCRERAVVVSRLRVVPKSNSVEFVSSFAAAIPGWSPGYPTLHDGYLVFDEGLSKETRVVHVERLDQDGFPVGSDHIVSSDAHPLARPFIGSTPNGKLVGWAEDADSSLPDKNFGRSTLRLQGLSSELAQTGELVSLAVTRFGSMGQPVVVPLAYPRGVLVAWSARSRLTAQYSIFAQFLSCSN